MERKKELDICNFVKTSPNRLGSLGNPRDLSLGATKQKKIYVPNVNAVRTKHKPKEIKDRIKKEFRNFKKLREEQDPKLNRYVQSSGVFNEGTGDILRKNSYKVDLDNVSERSNNVLAIPKLKKVNWEVNKKTEKETVDDLLNCDNSSSDNDSDYEPVVLPLLKKDPVIKTEQIKIKQEPGLAINTDVDHSKVKTEDFTSTLSSHTIFNNNTKFNDENLSFSLIKLPDSFAGKGFDDDTDELVDYTVKHMHEGQIGKIQIKQSGKIEVLIGNTVYVLDAEETPPFVEDIMIMPDQNEAYTDPLIGHVAPVTERFVLSPSWKNLFLNSKAKNSKNN